MIVCVRIRRWWIGCRGRDAAESVRDSVETIATLSIGSPSPFIWTLIAIRDFRILLYFSSETVQPARQLKSVHITNRRSRCGHKNICTPLWVQVCGDDNDGWGWMNRTYAITGVITWQHQCLLFNLFLPNLVIMIRIGRSKWMRDHALLLYAFFSLYSWLWNGFFFW